MYFPTGTAMHVVRHELREQRRRNRHEPAEGPPLPPAYEGSALHTAIRHAFMTMTSSYYAHKTHVDVQAGVYDFDCVLMIGYFLKRTNPEANREMRAFLGTRPGFVPSPKNWARFFRSLEPGTDTAWHRVVGSDDIHPGDIIIKPPANPDRPGHALVVATEPEQLPSGNLAVTIFDSTSRPHGGHDSRNFDPRNQARSGKPSGLGVGVIELVTTEDGGFDRMKSTVGGSLTGLPVLIGRPLS